jgi:tRNA (guanine37-N1)-methyltransferase
VPAKKTSSKIRFSILTAAPETIGAYAKASILGRAQKAGLISVETVALRDFAEGTHLAIDDKPFGGGPGMVLTVDPVVKAVKSVRPRKNLSTRVVLFSTRGKLFTQKEAERLATYKHIVFICGRYEGVDERIALHVADEEISMGDFVLTGGELPALTVIDAVSRLVPGVLGKFESLEHVNGSFPTYTRPESYKAGKETWDVPSVLLSGNHAAIEKWRRSAGSEATQ